MHKRLLCGVLALMMTACATSCGPGRSSASGDNGASVAKVNDPYTPYDDVITLTKGATVIGAGSLPSGDDFGNNVFTRYLENTQNIKTRSPSVSDCRSSIPRWPCASPPGRSGHSGGQSLHLQSAGGEQSGG